MHRQPRNFQQIASGTYDICDGVDVSLAEHIVLIFVDQSPLVMTAFQSDRSYARPAFLNASVLLQCSTPCKQGVAGSPKVPVNVRAEHSAPVRSPEGKNQRLIPPNIVAVDCTEDLCTPNLTYPDKRPCMMDLRQSKRARHLIHLQQQSYGYPMSAKYSDNKRNAEAVGELFQRRRPGARSLALQFPQSITTAYKGDIGNASASAQPGWKNPSDRYGDGANIPAREVCAQEHQSKTSSRETSMLTVPCSTQRNKNLPSTSAKSRPWVSSELPSLLTVPNVCKSDEKMPFRRMSRTSPLFSSSKRALNSSSSIGHRTVRVLISEIPSERHSPEFANRSGSRPSSRQMDAPQLMSV